MSNDANSNADFAEVFDASLINPCLGVRRIGDMQCRNMRNLDAVLYDNLVDGRVCLVERREDGEGYYYIVEIFVCSGPEITADDDSIFDADLAPETVEALTVSEDVRFDRDIEYERSTHLISKLSDNSDIFGDIVVASELLDYLNNDVNATVLGYALHAISSRRKARQFISDYCGALNISPHDLRLAQCEVLSLSRMVA